MKHLFLIILLAACGRKPIADKVQLFDVEEIDSIEPSFECHMSDTGEPINSKKLRSYYLIHSKEN